MYILYGLAGQSSSSAVQGAGLHVDVRVQMGVAHGGGPVPGVRRSGRAWCSRVCSAGRGDVVVLVMFPAVQT